jgi:hypothetical protein
LTETTPETTPPTPIFQRIMQRPLFLGIAAVAVILIVWAWRSHSASKSATVAASITLVTTDRDDLACASERTFGKYRCEFKAPGVAWPDPPTPENRLAGYYTVEQQLYVIPGLFLQPALAKRYAEEQAKNLPRDQRPRFNVNCQLQLTEHIRDFQTRWVKGGDFGHQDDAWVAIPSDCNIP